METQETVRSTTGKQQAASSKNIQHAVYWKQKSSSNCVYSGTLTSIHNHSPAGHKVIHIMNNVQYIWSIKSNPTVAFMARRRERCAHRVFSGTRTKEGVTGDTLSSVCELSNINSQDLDFKQATPTPDAFSVICCTRNKRGRSKSAPSVAYHCIRIHFNSCQQLDLSPYS